MSKIEVRPNVVQQGATVIVSGSGWPHEAIVVTVDNEVQTPAHLLRGSHWNGHVVPDANGDFLFKLPTDKLAPGKYTLRAATIQRGGRAEARLTVETRVVDPKAPRTRLNKPFLRGSDFKRRRLAKRASWPAGIVAAAKQGWKGKIVPFLAPVHGVCNWVPLGPAPFTEGPTASAGDNSGRIRAIAIDPLTPTRMYAGTATAGVWRSTDAGLTWSPRTDDKFSLAIGALAVDPSSPNIVYAGTGEFVPGSDYGAYYGNGLYQSVNFGDTWTDLGTSNFYLAEISRIVVNPLDGTNLFVAASNGLWESTTSGSGWTHLSPNPCTDVVLVQNPAEPGTRRLVAGFVALGVYASANSGSGWSAFTSVTVPSAPADPQNVVFGVCRGHKNVIYAAFCEGGGAGANMLAAVAKSVDWGASWSAETIPSGATGRTYQAPYNLAIQPDPNVPETVILLVVDVFKSTDSGGSWANVTWGGSIRVHADAHAIAFHPATPDNLYVGSDGGLFFSPDSCATWKTRNADLSSLQLYDIGQHPQYEAIMIVGSQDNGGFHYSGAPIWRRSWVRVPLSHNAMEGDGVVARIDPFNPYVHYYGTGPDSSTTRSDDAGRFFPTSWANFPGSEWLPSFETDPHTAGVIYTGGTRLHRSDNRGTSWNDITGDLAGSVRAIGFHPTDAHVVYAATNNGHVYRITGPAMGAWTTATVTLLDITYTGLPAGMGISSITGDAAGQVWVTISDILETELTGEFTNEHVWRLDSGATAWVSKSSGLAIANPINTIVADPADTTKLYCGGDRAVFRWDTGTQTWSAMDEGLPNAPVSKLVIHNPSRKLRAATFGRGVWERSLAGPCSDYFLYVRDNLVDSGTTPSPDYVPHPYVSGELCFHWQSPDIIVDSTNQTPAVVTRAVELYDNVQHDGAHRGSNRVYVTLHNKGPFEVTNARVRVFFAAATAGLPALPPALLADPFSWVPGGPSAWNPVGPAFSAGSVPPGTTRLAYWDGFVIPMSAEQHSCLLTFITSNEDPFNSGGIVDPDQLVLNNRKVALKNLDLDAMPAPGGAGPGGTQTPEGSTRPHEIMLNSKDGGLYRTAIVTTNLPPDAVIVAALDKRSRKAAKVEPVKLSKRVRKAGDTITRFKEHPKTLRVYDLDNAIVREAPPRQTVNLAELTITREKPVRLAVWIHAPKWDPNETYGYDVVQFRGQRVVGGYSVRFVAK